MAPSATDFDWDDLRYFLAVVRAGGLTGAAQALRVNHSTVYRRIGGLEEAVGARLFDRQPRGYALTAAGEEMREVATRIEEDVLALRRRVVGRDAALHGTVRLTTVDELATLLAPRLLAFHRAYPGIALEVEGEVRHASLSRREADVALRPGRRPTEPDVGARRLCGLATALYASAAYVEGPGGPVDPEDLGDHALVTFDGSLPGPLTEALLRRSAQPRVVFRANNMLGILAAARAGFGVALLPCFLGDCAAELVRVGAPAVDPETGVWLLVHADLRQTARVRAFVDFLAETVATELADLLEGRRPCAREQR